MMSLPREFDLVNTLRKEILVRLTLLLEHKHLYQNVHLDLVPIENTIRGLKGSPIPPSIASSHVSRGETQEEAHDRVRHPYRETLKAKLQEFWEFETESTPSPMQPTQQEATTFSFCLPTIKIACAHCDGVLPPHNSGFKGLPSNLPEVNLSKTTRSGVVPVQVFFIPYQCQNCKGEPVIFVVRREGTKLQIVGRSHPEQVDVPKTIPAEESRYYKDAVVAFDCGKILAALFYLRTMLEQYFRRVLNEHGRVPGEDLGDRYGQLLPDRFPRQFKSLRQVYEDLSIRLHAADEDANPFTASLEEIHRHFDLLKHFTLRKPEEANKPVESDK